ncbi:MAG: hypothetical protein Q9P90_13770 [candidate division KSB1 bacterium]|nr:hypothetical protein [candidate division KSB1 bacterium]
MHKLKRTLWLAAVLLVGACSENPVAPPDIDIRSLQAAPEKLTVAGKSLILSCSLWRDFMPISPPDGRPLVVVIAVQAADSTALPEGLDADAVYVIYEGQVWKAWLNENPDLTQPPYRLEKVARNGPKWGPGVYVDVVVRLEYGGKTYMLRASRQRIQKTS